MNKDQFSPEEQLVLYILQEVMVHDTARTPLAQRLAILSDWEKFKKIAVEQEVISFAFPVLKKTEIVPDKNTLDSLYQKHVATLAWTLPLEREYLRVAALFQEAGVDIVPLKGIAFLEDLYSDFPSRQMCDIDILIKEADFLKAEKLLQGAGYTKDLEGLKEGYWRKHQCHIVFTNLRQEKIPIRIEMHWGLDFKRKNREVLPELWKRICSAFSPQGPFKVLSPEDNLFSLALHLRRMGNILRLKNVLDAALILKNHSLDWEYILKEADRGKMRASIFFLLFQAQYFLGSYIPPFVWERLNIPTAQKKKISSFITQETFASSGSKKVKQVYKRGHFLLYDTWWEPFFYVLNIPLEQFAKFFDLPPYALKTRLLYLNRAWFIPFREVMQHLTGK